MSDRKGWEGTLIHHRVTNSNMTRYSGTSILRRAKGLAKYVRYKDVSLYQKSSLYRRLRYIEICYIEVPPCTHWNTWAEERRQEETFGLMRQATWWGPMLNLDQFFKKLNAMNFQLFILIVSPAQQYFSWETIRVFAILIKKKNKTRLGGRKKKQISSKSIL